MLRWMVKRAVARFGRAYDYDVSYMMEMVEVDPHAARLFGRLPALGAYRRAVPPAPWHAAKLRAEVVKLWGREGLLSLTLAMQVVRVFPAVPTFAAINGMPGMVLRASDGELQTLALQIAPEQIEGGQIEGGRIAAIYFIRNPEKLRHLPHPA